MDLEAYMGNIPHRRPLGSEWGNVVASVKAAGRSDRTGCVTDAPGCACCL